MKCSIFFLTSFILTGICVSCSSSSDAGGMTDFNGDTYSSECLDTRSDNVGYEGQEPLIVLSKSGSF